MTGVVDENVLVYTLFAGKEEMGVEIFIEE
jgi:hypothetical protein